MGFNAQKRRKCQQVSYGHHSQNTDVQGCLQELKQIKVSGAQVIFKKIIKAKWLLEVIMRLFPLWTEISTLTNQF